MYVSPNVAIPLPGILTYTKCMLVYALNHTSHISFVNDNFITCQFTQQHFPLNTHIFSNSHFTSVIYVKSWNLTRRYRCDSPTCNRSSTRAPLLLLHHACGPSRYESRFRSLLFFLMTVGPPLFSSCLISLVNPFPTSVYSTYNP